MAVMTTVVMRKTRDAGIMKMMLTAGVFTGLMDTWKGFMSRRRWSMHRLRRQASASFYRPSFLDPERVARQRLKSVQVAQNGE